MSTVVTFEMGRGAEEVWLSPSSGVTARPGRARVAGVVAAAAVVVFVGGIVGPRSVGTEPAGAPTPSLSVASPTAGPVSQPSTGPCRWQEFDGIVVQDIARMCQDHLAEQRAPAVRRLGLGDFRVGG